MSDNYIADAALLGFAKRNADAAGIDTHTIVNHKAGKALRETGAAA
jgi:hypothetical protein